MFRHNRRRTGTALIIILAIITIVGCSKSVDRGNQPILILYAFDQEGQLLSEAMTDRETDTLLGRPVFIGALEGKKIILAESGIGMNNAAMTAQKLIDAYNPRAVVFSGIAGAIDTSIRIGDVVVASQWMEHDYGYWGRDGFSPSGITVYLPSADSLTRIQSFAADSALLAAAQEIDQSALPFRNIGDRRPRLAVGGVGVSGNCFIDNSDRRIYLSGQFAALVTDMESQAVAQVCLINDLPFIAFRSASDLAGGSGSETAHAELEQFFAVAAENSTIVVREFLKRL